MMVPVVRAEISDTSECDSAMFGSPGCRPAAQPAGDKCCTTSEVDKLYAHIRTVTRDPPRPPPEKKSKKKKHKDKDKHTQEQGQDQDQDEDDSRRPHTSPNKDRVSSGTKAGNKGAKRPNTERRVIRGM